MELGSAHPVNHVSGNTAEIHKYPFIDFIRFISMMGIVWAHTEAFPIDSDYFHFLKDHGNAAYYIFFKQVFKFSVFCFFMISGFLLGDKITQVAPLDYLVRRIRSTLVPYLISLVLFMAIFLLSRIYLQEKSYDLAGIIQQTKYIIIGTPYWFIPTYFISLVTILVFNRFIDSYLFGAVLFLVTLMFTFPLEIVRQHVYGPNTVFFGYIFYIWFGIFVRRNNLIKWFWTISLPVITAIVFALFILSSLESLWLFNENEPLFFNILRFSNQLYGVAVFIFLVRICRTAPKFRFLNPRKETYGIYLYHFFFVAFIFPTVYRWFTMHTAFDFNSTFTVILFSVLHFVLCYFITTLFVKLLIRLRIPVL